MGQLVLYTVRFMGHGSDEFKWPHNLSERNGNIKSVRDSKQKDTMFLRIKVKRLLDFIVSATMLVLLSPVMLIIAAAIILNDGRPVFYRQIRVGQRGREFTMIKFRTMIKGADASVNSLQDQNSRSGPLFKINNDPRVTFTGRFLRRTSLDELPQLINVFIGTMSLVGPRPALPSEVAHFPDELRLRESLPQGITGLWQLNGRMDSDFGRYAELDLRYVETWSLRQDLAILLRTPLVVFAHALKRHAVLTPAAQPTIAEPSESTAADSSSSSNDACGLDISA